MVACSPKDRTQARTSRSEPAFVEEYGLEGLYGRLFGEPFRVIEFQVAVDLVGGDVVETLVVLPGGLDQRVGADDVRVQERARIMQ